MNGASIAIAPEGAATTTRRARRASVAVVTFGDHCRSGTVLSATIVDIVIPSRALRLT